MRCHSTGSPPHKGKSRPEGKTPERLHVPNLAVWSGLNNIKRRKLQLYAEAIIRAYKVHRHLKRRHEETSSLGNTFRSGGAR